MMLTTRKDLAKTSPIIGQILLCFSLMSLGALLLIDPDWIPSPTRNGAMTRRVVPASIILRYVGPMLGSSFSTKGER